MLIFPAVLAAQSELEQELAKLKEQRDRAVATVIEPIDQRYFEMLDQILKRAIQSNDEPAVEKIREQLASINGKPVDSGPGEPKRPAHVPADATAFNGNWYRVYLDKCRWRSARDKCVRLGGQLVVIPGQETQEFVKKLANSRDLWIGATDAHAEGGWEWVDGSPMDFTFWAEGEPTNEGGGGREEFVHMRPGGRWNDSRDKNTMVVGYICEWVVK